MTDMRSGVRPIILRRSDPELYLGRYHNLIQKSNLLMVLVEQNFRKNNVPQNSLQKNDGKLKYNYCLDCQGLITWIISGVG